MSPTPATPEAHHSRLLDEIEYDLTVYGVASLADIIASMLDARADTDDNRPRAAHYRAARDLYAQLAEQLSALARPFTLPDADPYGAQGRPDEQP